MKNKLGLSCAKLRTIYVKWCSVLLPNLSNFCYGWKGKGVKSLALNKNKIVDTIANWYLRFSLKFK